MIVMDAPALLAVIVQDEVLDREFKSDRQRFSKVPASDAYQQASSRFPTARF